MKRHQNIELALSGAVASLSLMMLPRADLPLFKAYVYMRAVQAFLLLLEIQIRKLLNLQGKEVISNGDFLLPAITITLACYAISSERKAAPSSIFDRVMDVSQVSKGQVVMYKVWD